MILPMVCGFSNSMVSSQLCNSSLNFVLAFVVSLVWFRILPVNLKWTLLKFFKISNANHDVLNALIQIIAPWCTHCKKIAPTLDAMAPYLSGKLAIGKVDCTTEKPVCQKYGVSGYPTLKIYRDGDFFDYPGKRDADSMIEFAEKMSMPAVSLVHSREEADEALATSSNGVLFMAFDPKAKEVSKNTAKSKGGEELTPVEKFLASTNTLQVFGQVARKVQDRSTFMLLHPGSKDEIEKFGLNGKSKKPFIVKIENDVDPLVYDYEGQLNSMNFMDFVKENNVALVTDLQGHNFRSVGHLGKPLFIGIVDSAKVGTDDKMSSFVSKLRNFAKGEGSGKDVKDDYKFATMDGVKWSNFLKQFSISSKDLPQILVLDVPKRKFYQNETIADIEAFVKGMKNGTIEQREQVSQAGNGPLEKFHGFFVKYMPYTLLAVVLFVGLMIYIVLADDDDEIRYQEMLKAQKEKAQKLKAKRKVKPVKED